MSGDIKISQFQDGSFDISISNDDLDLDDGLRTAIYLSLFTDRRVDADELSPEDHSRRGWWGDLLPDVPGDQVGSRLWLLRRRKRDQETLNLAEDYSEECLQWAIEDGVASDVSASASYDLNGFMIISITLTKPSGQTVPFRFEPKWATEENT